MRVLRGSPRDAAGSTVHEFGRGAESGSPTPREGGQACASATTRAMAWASSEVGPGEGAMTAAR